MSPQIQKKTAGPVEAIPHQQTLDIVVLYTSADLAGAALERAEELAKGMNLRVRLVCAQIVPYALPIDEPQILLEHLKNELEKVADMSGLEIQGEIVLAREMQTALRSALKPGSIVVLASHRRVWRTKEESLRNECIKAGHEVVLCYAR